MDDEHELTQIHSPRKKIQKSTNVQEVEETQKGDTAEESLEEGEIHEKNMRECQVSER